jgi:hypothetical protein
MRLGRVAQVNALQIHARGHHVRRLQLAQAQHAREHGAFVGVEDALLLADLRDGEQFVVGDRAGLGPARGERLCDPLEQRAERAQERPRPQQHARGRGREFLRVRHGDLLG